MAKLEAIKSSKIRKGEAGSIKVTVPETDNLKELTMVLPKGVSSPDGEEINLAPKMTCIDIPILVSKEAPEHFTIKFHLVEKTPTKGKSTELFADYSMDLEE
jgi:hypothetical protein